MLKKIRLSNLKKKTVENQISDQEMVKVKGGTSYYWLHIYAMALCNDFCGVSGSSTSERNYFEEDH